MVISEIFIYPIKSCQGIRVDQAQVTPKGFIWDREFMLVDSNGVFLTQRQHPQLATIKVLFLGNLISLSVKKTSLKPFIFKPSFTGLEIEVDIWGTRTIAIDQGQQVAEWFKTALDLEENCRLVRQSPKYIRLVDQKYAVKENDQVSWADGYPFLLTATASLAELNRKILDFEPQNFEEVPMNRFRPNIVVKTTEPFIENNWKFIQFDEIIFDIVKPCSRCIITTTDQLTGKKNHLQEPLRTLSKFQFAKESMIFGVNMIPRNQGFVSVSSSYKIG
ncbi:MOSC domain-containing protein [Gloeothece verrucosa]|uniref:MOSC domain containing protein n=1 Tax=Gloeothece verrucosa (strain PCC 7822) TaxID=497965 RepID=E0UKN7_GLOV7|nr:MOSC N-terminal beta barrel domain-containing protein [Gloeothece verrucosa]ADN17517.1 MOSC domain containing protein [Gloeothece verrucosa PCC 7822]